MFTGIVQRLGTIVSFSSRDRDVELVLATGFTDLELGESVAVNGVCLTVTKVDLAGETNFHVSPETLERTNLGKLREGQAVNLERALRPMDRLSGHYVQGHVDGLGKILTLASDGESYLLEVLLPMVIGRYVVAKGSIALNGVSLTLNRIEEMGATGLKVATQLVPHTWQHTSFSQSRVGDPVNVEVDILAKYVEKLCR